MSGSGIRWAICKSAPRSRQITTPAPHRSVFYRPDALPAAQPTASQSTEGTSIEGTKSLVKQLTTQKQNINANNKLKTSGQREFWWKAASQKASFKNCPFPWGDSGRRLIHGSLGPPESTTQTASRSVYPFLHSSWSCPTPTDRHTDHRMSATVGRILHSLRVRYGLKYRQ